MFEPVYDTKTNFYLIPRRTPALMQCTTAVKNFKLLKILHFTKQKKRGIDISLSLIYNIMINSIHKIKALFDNLAYIRETHERM